MENEQKQAEGLSRKKKAALVKYLAILFAVAFLLVAVSLLAKVIALQNDFDAANRGADANISALEHSTEQLEAQNRALQLLCLAQESYRIGDNEAFFDTMGQLAAYADSLPEQAKNIYNRLLPLHP